MSVTIWLFVVEQSVAFLSCMQEIKKLIVADMAVVGLSHTSDQKSLRYYTTLWH